MDNFCHSLAGWALARTGLGRSLGGASGPVTGVAEIPPRRGTGSPAAGAAETLLLVVASNFPDLDLVLGLVSTEAYMLWHRGLTHSLLGLLIFPPALAFLGQALAPGLSFRRALLLCEIGAASHIALDLLTTWGTIALYPWSHRRFALDWIFIVDPVLWVVLLGGILLGVRRADRTRRRAALGALLLGMVYVAGAGAAHQVAAGRVREILASSAPRERGSDVDVFPLPFPPWRWHAVAWRGDSLMHVSLEGLPARATSRSDEAHGLGAPAVREALLTPPGQAFLWWARAPACRVLRRESGRTVVGLSDRRYAFRDAELFGMEIIVDEAGGYLGATWEGDSVFRR